MLLNLAVGGDWPGNPDSSTTFPQQMLVDYVRVYTRDTSPAATLSPTVAHPGDDDHHRQEIPPAAAPSSPPNSRSYRSSGLTRFLNRARPAVGLPGQVDVLLADDPS